MRRDDSERHRRSYRYDRNRPPLPQRSIRALSRAVSRCLAKVRLEVRRRINGGIDREEPERNLEAALQVELGRACRAGAGVLKCRMHARCFEHLSSDEIDSELTTFATGHPAHFTFPACPAVTPSCALNLVRSRARARCSLDRTVPIGQSSTWAASA
jgi:hypothetical protein